MDLTDRDIAIFEASIVPCSIEYDGKVERSSSFFDIEKPTTYLDEEIEVRYFRGLRLLGRTINFGTKTPFLIKRSETVEESNASGELKSTRTYWPIAKISHIKNFGHDQPPPSHDKWELANEWEQFANIIHE